MGMFTDVQYAEEEMTLYRITVSDAQVEAAKYLFLLLRSKCTNPAAQVKIMARLFAALVFSTCFTLRDKEHEHSLRAWNRQVLEMCREPLLGTVPCQGRPCTEVPDNLTVEVYVMNHVKTEHYTVSETNTLFGLILGWVVRGNEVASGTDLLELFEEEVDNCLGAFREVYPLIAVH